MEVNGLFLIEFPDIRMVSDSGKVKAEYFRYYKANQIQRPWYDVEIPTNIKERQDENAAD